MTRTRPLPLTVAAGLVALEALVSAVYGVAFLVGFKAPKATLDVTGFLFFLLCAAGLAACAYGLFRLVSWARGPVVFTQLMLLLLAWSFHGLPAVAAPMAVLGVVVLVCLFVPASMAALNPEE